MSEYAHHPPQSQLDLNAMERMTGAPPRRSQDAARGQSAELARANSAVQGKGELSAGDAAAVHQTAAEGITGSGGKLPHYEKVQASFGHHDISGIQAHTGGAARQANDSMGSLAYATGNAVAFSGSPDLHTAAHEAAHVVQQRNGVALKDGVGREGDAYERHADAVADRVVQGKSAEGLLDEMAGRGANASPSSAVQMALPAANYNHKESKLPGQKPGQSKGQRAKELETADKKDMDRGVANAKGWDQEMNVLRDNTNAIYAECEAGFRQYALAMYEAFENHQAIMTYVSQKRAETAALVGAIVGIGLAVASAGASVMASGFLGQMAGRFSNLVGVAGVNATKAINEGMVELFKQGIQVGGGAMLKYTPTTPKSLGNASTVRAFKDQGLTAISREKADMASAIAWLTNNRGQLEGHFSPKSIVANNAARWARMKAGAKALSSGADTKKLEISIWRDWIGKHGKHTYTTYSCALGPQQRESFNVSKYILEHLQSRLGINEATARRWAGM